MGFFLTLVLAVVIIMNSFMSFQPINLYVMIIYINLCLNVINYVDVSKFFNE